jgi:(2Fe-2S) ferredoxin
MPNLEMPLSDFSLVGELLEFFKNDRQEIEAISVIADDRKWRVKLSKKLQLTIDTTLPLGSYLDVRGTTKKQSRTGRTMLVAKSLTKVAIDGFCPKPIFEELRRETTATATQIKQQPERAIEKTSILVCSRSKCWKRGGKDICQLLKENVRSRGWQNKVNVETTGCLKQCKYAPNLIMMPDETRYSQVSLKEIPLLLDKHI